MSNSKNERDKKSNKVKVPLLPLRDVIIFPHMVVPLFVGREKSINALFYSGGVFAGIKLKTLFLVKI